VVGKGSSNTLTVYDQFQVAIAPLLWGAFVRQIVLVTTDVIVDTVR
jgi:hypothetical protein